MNSRSRVTARFEQVDSLRAVACTLVILDHSSGYFLQFASSGLLLAKLARIFNIGWMGVLIFFSISGFVVPRSLQSPDLKGAKDFIIRRFWRLYPAYWTALVAISLINFGTIEIPHLIWQLTMLPIENRLGFYEGGHFWTLQVELLFYLLILLLSLIFGRLKLKSIFSIFNFF